MEVSYFGEAIQVVMSLFGLDMDFVVVVVGNML